MHTAYMAHSLSEYVRSCSEETINWHPLGFLFYLQLLLLQNGHNNYGLSFFTYLSLLLNSYLYTSIVI
jgi:hypothetical protein